MNDNTALLGLKLCYFHNSVLLNDMYVILMVFCDWLWGNVFNAIGERISRAQKKAMSSVLNYSDQDLFT